MKTTYTAFKGYNLFAHGPLDEVVLAIKGHIGKSDHSSVFIFSDSTGKMIDFNFQGTQKDIIKRLEVFISEENPKENTGPGRPKLGVISREVSLLPQHWEWLATQPGGASAILRKLVDEAKKKSQGTPTTKQIQEKIHRFVSSIAGDFQGYEEALRALYRKDKKEFSMQIESWPTDIKKYVLDLAKPIFNNENE